MHRLISPVDDLGALISEVQRDTFLFSLLVRSIDFEGVLPNDMMDSLWFLEDAMKAHSSRFDSILSNLALVSKEMCSRNQMDRCIQD